jgi:hypothetical protein
LGGDIAETYAFCLNNVKHGFVVRVQLRHDGLKCLLHFILLLQIQKSSRYRNKEAEPGENSDIQELVGLHNGDTYAGMGQVLFFQVFTDSVDAGGVCPILLDISLDKLDHCIDIKLGRPLAVGARQKMGQGAKGIFKAHLHG